MKTKTWSYSYNNYSKYQIGNIHLVIRPLWVSFLDWFVMSVIGRFCCMFHWIVYPKFLKVTDKENGETYTWREYYGDFGSTLHLYLFSPLVQLVFPIIERNQTEWIVEIGYTRLREIFGESDKNLEPVYGTEEKICQQM